ncbi:MAG: hypothetical protein E7176_02030 [Erysipelotrichaceae bacterium]|nr:hypothetical protein [Erysipelotrichaceae bacterium]
MAFWSKKSIRESIIEYLEEQKVSYKEEFGCITFELYFKRDEFSIFPYIKINEMNEELSFVVNLKEVDNYKDCSKLNKFNALSKFVAAKAKDNLLFLEYNCFTNPTVAPQLIDKIVESLYGLQSEIDKL